MDFLSGLNPQQREAVTHAEGPLLILAGAGTGKTRVITHRIAYLIAERGVPPHAILAVTFTNKAAGEMRERVHRLLEGRADLRDLIVSTFHSFCVRLLRRSGAPLAAHRPGFTPQFSIYDEDDQLGVIKSVFRNEGLDEKFMPYRGALSRISHAKNRGDGPAEMRQGARDAVSVRLASLFEQYQTRLLEANALDFDDLLLEAVRLLRTDDATRVYYNHRFQFLLIDEYQDTNRPQYELMRLLTEAHQNVCVVGDEDQSIYSWRGADIRNILDFEQDYPNARTIRLEQNYRSTQIILSASSHLVSHNLQRKGKTLWCDAGAGDRIKLYRAADAENEALFIADTIDRLLALNPEEKIAVLYRTNAQSRQIEEALRRYNQPYAVIGGFSFYQRAEIKDIMAYLKVIQSPQDTVSLQRILNVPARGIGRTTVEELERIARSRGISFWDALRAAVDQHLVSPRAEAALREFVQLITKLQDIFRRQPLPLALKALYEATSYEQMLQSDPSPDAESRLENLNELANAASDAFQRGETLTEFLDHAALSSATDTLDENARVSLLTLHNAKGLEFPIVFIAGMEHGLFPHSRSSASQDLLEEERRLCYVGMTRAQKQLYLSWARYRRRWGGGPLEPSLPSPFLREIPAEMIEELTARQAVPEVDLFVEQAEVRETVKRNLYTGKVYNSLDNISQFFAARGLPPLRAAAAPSPATPPPASIRSSSSVPPPPSPAPAFPSARAAATSPAAPAPPPASTAPSPPPATPSPAPTPARRAPKPRGFRAGAHVLHPKYGRGIILRKEGDGEDAKLTISFAAHGLKKVILKYAGITLDE